MPGRFNKLRELWRRRIAASLVVIVFAIFCDQSRAQPNTNSSDGVWQNAKEGGSNTWSAVKSDTKQGWENAKARFASATVSTNYAYAKKDVFVGKAKTELDDITQKINRLTDRTESASASVKAQMAARMTALKSKQAELTLKYNAAKNATETDWGKAQVEFQNTYNDAKNSVKSAWEWLKSKTNQ